ncbi:hypothetical protein ACFLVI_00435 [Chloroflexota bacterium]
MSDSMHLKSKMVELPDSLEEVYDFTCQQRWGDGLPVIPPTEERVARMITYLGREPDEMVVKVAITYGEATVEKLAINSVMAGCLPEHFPIVVAAVEAK